MKRRKSETAEPKDLKSQTKTSWLYLLARQWRIENQILAPLLKFKITRLNDFAPIFNQSEAKSSNLIGSWFRLQFGERLRLMSVCWYVLKEKNISFLVDIEISKALFFFFNKTFILRRYCFEISRHVFKFQPIRYKPASAILDCQSYFWLAKVFR